MVGNAYIAPSMFVHDIPSMAWRASDKRIERRFKEAKISSRSVTYWRYDASPSEGGLTIKPVAIWPMELLQREMDANL